MTSLSSKLQIKQGQHWLFYNAPEDYIQWLEPLPKSTTWSLQAKGHFDGIQVFANNKAELSSLLKVIIPLLQPDTVFWISYPKRSSGIASDMKMGSWDELNAYDLQGVASISVNEQWAGSRFRPKGQAKISGTANTDIRKNAFASYIDVDHKLINLPPDMKEVLQKAPQAMDFFQQLSYSNKKEFVLWILTAKQEKPRRSRLEVLVEKLMGGKKNPYEK